MKKQDKVKKIHKILDELYPKPQKPLNHKDAYTLLIAVLLSARCTDKKVNEVTPELFKIADNPKDMSKIDVRTIRKIVKPCGLSPQKSKEISNLSKILVEKYDGKVPDNSRLQASPGLMGRFNQRSLLAVQNYLSIAKKYEINPVHLALAYCDQKPFMGSIIFGATTTEQLKTIINGLDTKLSTEVLKELDKVHREFPFPI